MAIEEKKAELLQEAFSRFSETSLDLERYYRLLQAQVAQLKSELEAKNHALEESLQQREALREQAERNHRLAAVGEMAARMAHELRNPLGSIELFASLLKKGVADPSLQRYAGYISSAVAAMDYALSNLLLFTRTPTPSYRKTDLRRTLEEARLFALPLIEQNRIRWIESKEALPESVRCDEDLLRQILLNLILNAVEAMPQGGELRVAVAPQERDEKTHADRGAVGGVRITVRDTGEGIPAEILPRIFDPFFTTKSNGTGLGLAIVHHAVTALEGSIQVQSEIGRGTTFTLILPASPAGREERSE
jgi:signal transduction histidine kinase